MGERWEAMPGLGQDGALEDGQLRVNVGIGCVRADEDGITVRKQVLFLEQKRGK